MPRQAIIPNRRKGTVTWILEGKAYECKIAPGACPLCGALDAVTELPPPLRAKQPDKTTHVCNPALDGCNHGFEKTEGVPQ